MMDKMKIKKRKGPIQKHPITFKNNSSTVQTREQNIEAIKTFVWYVIEKVRQPMSEREREREKVPI